MKTILLSLFSLLLLTGCGTTGKTNKFTLRLTNSVSSANCRIQSGTVAMEPNAPTAQWVAVNNWGLFDTNDLAHIEQSLADTLAASQPKSNPGAERMRAHLLVRKYHLTASNTGGAILASVAWALTDSNGEVLFHEQFYAANKVYLIGTLGLLKDALHRDIIHRIVETSLKVAASPQEKPNIQIKHTFSSYDEAVKYLPKKLISLGVAPVGPSAVATAGGLLLPRGKAEMDWESVQNNGEIDWNLYLAKVSNQSLSD